MADWPGKLAALEQEVAKLNAPDSAATDRFRSDAQALAYHRGRNKHKPIVAILGGTGTGKSTVVNRLLESEVSAASFRRTFTSGAVAIAERAGDVPSNWLGVPREAVEQRPSRGDAGKLMVVEHSHPLTAAVTLVDTPDLDGDQPVHHAEADRVFRWADAVAFLVTPEKYQMTELLPYYRLAQRYAVPAAFAMNKCEEAAVLEDYRQQLSARGFGEPRLFVVARDDAAYEPPHGQTIGDMRRAIEGMGDEVPSLRKQEAWQEGLKQRARDLLGRLRDQIVAPLRQQRREVDRLVAGLKAMMMPPAGVDVAPVTGQLQRRLQEQSVLYLMGPQRMLDRVRQVPGLLLRLPRNAWDFMRGQTPDLNVPKGGAGSNGAVPDFPTLLTDQFTILQSRIEDLVLSTPSSQAWMNGPAGEAYRAAKFPAGEAGNIANEELAALKAWLEQRWQATPRDTAIVQKLLAVLPGGKRLAKWSEAAPYLLAVVVAAHGAIFGPIDLIIIGSFSLATWLGEKLSNEVTARTRQANRQIGERYSTLAREQLERVCRWLETLAPREAELARVERLAEEIEGALEGR